VSFRNIRASEDQDYSESSDSEIGPSYSPMIRTDEERLMQILLMLQSNSLKYTVEGSVSIHVEIITDEEE